MTSVVCACVCACVCVLLLLLLLLLVCVCSCVCSCVEVARVPPTMCCALNDICVCHHADYSAARDSYVYTQMHTHTHTHTVRGWCVFTR